MASPAPADAPAVPKAGESRDSGPREAEEAAGASDGATVERMVREVEGFYARNPQIKESHGIRHVMAVHAHATKAVACAEPPLAAETGAEIEMAALLHDVDDHKYFPDGGSELRNARDLCRRAGVPPASVDRILAMIRWVGCSENGNRVPPEVEASGAYHLLIPRWSDRLEAVGAIGVVRCYRYNEEHGRALCSDSTPRARTAEEVFALATPERFERYTSGEGHSDDMISHYFDKLLHVARPPPEIVRNRYLESMAEESSRELVEVCVRFGRTGVVDTEYILGLEAELAAKSA